MTTLARDKSFDRVATEYDAARPGYPDAVYDRILEFGSLPPETKVLEVGLGTGKATLPLARRGFEIHGIEPGADLSAIARRNLAPFPRVTIATTTFEASTIEREAFGLAFSAQAFHWLDQKVRLERFAEALPAGGVLAVFGNVPHVPAGLLRDELDEAYQDLAPALASARDAGNWYGTLPPAQLAALLARVAEVVHSHGGLALSYTTGLFLARRV